MSKRTRNRRTTARREITTPDGLITVPPGSPKILIHTRGGRCVGIYCDQPAKVLCVETQGDPRCLVDPSNLAMLSLISPQTSAKVVGGFSDAVFSAAAVPLADDGGRFAAEAEKVKLQPERL
jgi:hypothetical protein